MKKYFLFYALATLFGLAFYDTYIYFKTSKARNEAIKMLEKSREFSELSSKILSECKRSLELEMITPELEDLVDDISDLTGVMLDDNVSRKFLS